MPRVFAELVQNLQDSGIGSERFGRETRPGAADVIGLHIGVLGQSATKETTVGGTVGGKADAEFLQGGENFCLGLAEH